LTTFNYRDLFEAHVSSKAWGTIALHQREVKIDYGVVEFNKEGLLCDYIEKPTIPYFVSMGINMLSRNCLEFIPDSGKFDMPELMLAMHQAGKRVVCYKTDCYWQDIGRFDDYQHASEDFLAEPARFLEHLEKK
jgi:NDP-sugar pyrophosphorylase family protein